MADTAVDRPTTSSRTFPWGVVSVVALSVLLIGLVASYEPAVDPATEIGSLIRCPVCQGVPIADSPAPMARDMMVVLREALADGATRQEAINEVLGAYPGSLLLEPTLSGSTVILWLAPLAALIIGAGLALTVRRSRQGEDSARERSELEHRRRQVQADLDELAVQVAGGEVDPEAAAHLRAAYRAELAEAETALAEASEETAPLPRSRRRTAVGAGIVVAALAMVVATAGAFLVDRPGATSGVAGLEGDPSEFSNETLAAVIAANTDHPQIDGMRLALAERFFEAGDYQSAFPYYLEVADSEQAATTQVATALTRLGWMAFDGNGEVETALNLLSQAQRLVPDDPFPLYLEGVVTWCGRGDGQAAAAAFREVLAAGVQDEAIRGQVEADLAAAEAGEPCDR